MPNANLQNYGVHRHTRSSTNPLFLPLLGSLENLLRSGGDDRIEREPGGINNQYGFSPRPQPEILECASSTATTISERAYQSLEETRNEMLDAAARDEAELAFQSRIEALRRELRASLELKDGDAELIFAPSGTDSALHAAFIAGAVLDCNYRPIVVGSDETGSRVGFASSGFHFGSRTALGVDVQKGSALEGFARPSSSMEIALRDPAGNPIPLPQLDLETIENVGAAIRSGQKVALYAMDCSKTGLHGPSMGALGYISERWPDDVFIVVDACQMRLSRSRLKQYLSLGCTVMITGSKFFTGPPFSGGLLLPPVIASRVACASVPDGLAAYTARWSWPESWSGIRQQLSAKMNFGEWLRWEAALEEIQAYFRVPFAYRSMALRKFEDRISHFIANISGLAPITVQAGGVCRDDQEFGRPTILPFGVLAHAKPLSLSAITCLHRRLMDGISDGAQHFGVRRFGQPVVLGSNGSFPTAALRVSASSRLVAEAWLAGDSMDAQPNLDRELLRIGEALEIAAFLATREGP